MAKVDVIIPAYNAAKYLPDAIQSVEEQTFADWQIVLVDDGSTDDTQAVLAPFRERLGGKFRYLRKDNAGVTAARNTALQNSSSEFIALLDADDVWLPCRLAESLKSFEARPEVGLSYGFIRYMNERGEPLEWEDRRQKNAEGQIATHIYTRRVHLPAPTITFRRRCIEEVGTFDETLKATEDRDLWLRIAFRYEVRLVEQVTSYYRLSPNSLTKNSERMMQTQMQFIEKHYGAAGCGRLQRRVAISRIYKERADALIAQSKYREAMRYCLHALALNPLDSANARATVSLLLKWTGLKRP